MEDLAPISIVSLGLGYESLSVRAVKTLAEADRIFCPSTNGHSHAYDILQLVDLKSDSIVRYELPMSKNRTGAYEAYDKVVEEAVRLRSEGKEVAIVAEGDAGFYSSTTYMADKLRRADVPVRQIAGVPAFIAAAASIGLPVVEQEERLTVCPGKVDEALFDRIEAGSEVAVVMKLSQCEAELKKILQSDRKLTCHYFERVGTEEEFYTCDVQEILEKKFPYFSLMIIKRR